MDVETPTKGRHIPEACIEEKKGVPPETPWQAWTQGGLAFPPERWPWEAHDVTLVTLDAT